jgi:hypothetical protein
VLHQGVIALAMLDKEVNSICHLTEDGLDLETEEPNSLYMLTTSSQTTKESKGKYHNEFHAETPPHLAPPPLHILFLHPCHCQWRHFC